MFKFTFLTILVPADKDIVLALINTDPFDGVIFGALLFAPFKLALLAEGIKGVFWEISEEAWLNDGGLIRFHLMFILARNKYRISNKLFDI